MYLVDMIMSCSNLYNTHCSGGVAMYNSMYPTHVSGGYDNELQQSIYQVKHVSNMAVRNILA